MRIVNRKEFLSMPNGIIYSTYQSLGMINGLCEKGDSLTNDWYYQNLIDTVDARDSAEWTEVLIAAEETGSEFKMDLECGERDGSFDDKDMFVVYDKNDVYRLIGRLVEIVNRYPEEEKK